MSGKEHSRAPSGGATLERGVEHARGRALLLDFGGTLDSDGRHWSTQFARAFAEAGFVVPRESLDRAFLAADRRLDREVGIEALGLREHVQLQTGLMLGHLGLPPDGVEPVVERFVGHALEHIARSRELLQRHRPGCRVGLVSNFTPNLMRIVEQTGLSQVVDTVACSALEGVSKPDPALFRRALDRLGVGPEHAAMVGDSPASDIVPARALGMTTCWIRGDQVFVAADEGAAHHIVTSLAGALDCLAQGGFFG